MSKGRPPTPKAPQEKKALSLAKDRRNGYGENDKSSRKAIPQRKAWENRKVRHAVNQALGLIERLDEAAADVVESSARQDVGRVGGWTKAPDAPLGEYIERQALSAEQRVGTNGGGWTFRDSKS